MSTHPVYDIKSMGDLKGAQNILSPKLVFTKRLLHKVATPEFDDYINEGKV